MNKSFLMLLMAGALIFLTVWAVYGQGPKSVERQSWEYKSIYLVRSASTNSEFSDWGEATGQIFKQLPPPVSMPVKAKELGEQGWELVSVTAISNNTCDNCGGFTSQINYWFKRPK